MKRKLLKVVGILSVLYFVTTGFTTWKHVNVEYNLPSENAMYTVQPTVMIDSNDEIVSPIIGKSFIGFKEAGYLPEAVMNLSHSWDGIPIMMKKLSI